MTYYQILGVKKSATQDEIKDAYKKLMKKYHPDVYQGDKVFAEQKTKQINLAYDVLSNPSAKAAYDEQLNPTPNYRYTPPKYDSSYNGSQDYYEKYAHRYTANAYTNSYYTKAAQVHSDVSNKIIKSLSKLKLIQKLLLLLLVALIYLTLLLLTFTKFAGLQSGEYTGPLLNEEKKVITEPEPTTPQDPVVSGNNKSNHTFDINDYISDEELYERYINGGYSSMYTFDEFKEELTKIFINTIPNY